MPNKKSFYSLLLCRSDQSVSTIENNTSPSLSNHTGNGSAAHAPPLPAELLNPPNLEFPVIQVTNYLDMSSSTNVRDFNNKVVIVTCSSSGIGAEAVKYFSRYGAQVVVTGRNAKAMNDIAAECGSLSPNKYQALQVQADVTKDEDCRRIVENTINHYGHLDILINNADAGAFGSVYDPKLLSTLENMYNVNLRSLVLMTQLAVPHLEKTRGVIINMSSTLSLQPNVHFMPYCVAKAGVDMFTKCMAVELGPKGIRVNAINPTALRTNFQASTGASEILEQVLKGLEETNPLRRIATTEDVVNCMGYVASSLASFVNGVCLVVDGGSIYV